MTKRPHKARNAAQETKSQRISKKSDRRFTVIAIVFSILFLLLLLFDLAHVLTLPSWDFGDIYHMAATLIPLGIGACLLWIFRSEQKQSGKTGRKGKST